jgi:hypothetical protein
VSSARAEVVGGVPSGVEDDAVVVVWGDAGSVLQRCTGSMVAPNLVLTARHCIANYVDQPFTCTPSGDLTPDSTGGQIGATLAPDKITVRTGTGPDVVLAATGVQVFSTQTTSICRNDIALVLLDQALTTPIAPLRLTAGTTPGELVRVVGYGASEDGGFGVRLTHAGLTISMVGESQFRPTGDPVPPRTFATDGPAACFGDSGGPALDAREAVTGILSQVSGDCMSSTARDFYTQIAPFKDELFTPAFTAAGYLPQIEDVPDAGTNDAGNADSGASDAGSDSDASEIDYHEPRQAGGCRCRIGVRSESNGESALALLFALTASRRRRTRARQRRYSKIAKASAATSTTHSGIHARPPERG